MSPRSAVEFSAGALSVSLVSAGLGGILVVSPSIGWMSNPSPVDEAAPDIPDGALLPGSDARDVLLLRAQRGTIQEPRPFMAAVTAGQ